MSKDALVSPVTEDGWFAESEVMWPGQKFALQLDTSVGVRGVLHHSRSLFQEVLVLQTVEYGRALVLDGVIQLTERDEFAYQEMIVHLPMFAHARPKRVLVVGGGLGGSRRTGHFCSGSGVLRVLRRHNHSLGLLQCCGNVHLVQELVTN